MIPGEFSLHPFLIFNLMDLDWEPYINMNLTKINCLDTHAHTESVVGIHTSKTHNYSKKYE